jgi:ribosomal protein L14
VQNEDNTFTFFNDNAISLINKQNGPIATRIIGPVSKKLKNKYTKFTNISVGQA